MRNNTLQFISNLSISEKERDGKRSPAHVEAPNSSPLLLIKISSIVINVVGK